jgi:hypothetical protein
VGAARATEVPAEARPRAAIVPALFEGLGTVEARFHGQVESQGLGARSNPSARIEAPLGHATKLAIADRSAHANVTRDLLFRPPLMARSG